MCKSLLGDQPSLKDLQNNQDTTAQAYEGSVEYNGTSKQTTFEGYKLGSRDISLEFGLKKRSLSNK